MKDLCLFGVAGHPRTAQLARAFAARGSSLVVVDYKRALAPEFQAPAARCYKLDAPGQDEALDRALLHLSDGSLRPRAHGEVWSRRAWFAGFKLLLERIQHAVGPAARWFNPPIEVLQMSDKLQCQLQLRSVGVAVPPLLQHSEILSFEQLLGCMAEQRVAQVFLKSRYGSSASAVLALRLASGGRCSAWSSARLHGGRLYNHLRVQHLAELAQIRALVDAISAGGAYAERWLPKPRAPGATDGSCYDLRVIARSGTPRQMVARLSRTPLTNLHLGNQRAEPAWLDPSQHEAVNTSIRAVQRAFPRSLSMGVDLLLHGGHARVLEVNAFGDWLQGVLFAQRTTFEDQALWCAA